MVLERNSAWTRRPETRTPSSIVLRLESSSAARGALVWFSHYGIGQHLWQLLERTGQLCYSNFRTIFHSFAASAVILEVAAASRDAPRPGGTR